MTTQPLVDRAIRRGLGDRYDQAAADVRRIVEASYRVVEREGSVDPRIRDILEEAGLSTDAFYRHFGSKDELLLVLLADGRHRLAGYLVHQMDKAPDAVGRVRAWVDGVLAQAVDPEAASRTRPFVANLSRLAERFPEELALSVEALVAPLRDALAEGRAAGSLPAGDDQRDAAAVYQLVISTMETHLLAGTRPDRRDLAHLEAFCLRAIGAAPDVDPS